MIIVGLGRAGHISFPCNKFEMENENKRQERERTNKQKMMEGWKTVFVKAIVAPVAIHELSRPMKVYVVQALQATSGLLPSPLGSRDVILHDVTLGLSPPGQCQCILKALLYIMI